MRNVWLRVTGIIVVIGVGVYFAYALRHPSVHADSEQPIGVSTSTLVAQVAQAVINSQQEITRQEELALEASTTAAEEKLNAQKTAAHPRTSTPSQPIIIKHTPLPLPIPQAVTIPAQSIPVLLYHGEGGSMQNTPTQLFADQMQALSDAGWHTITLEQFQDFVKNGTPVQDKSFLLTFDDGRKDTYYATDPILQKLGFSAVMFVITGFSMPDNGGTSTFYLSQQELETMFESGRWELESHSKEAHRFYTITTTLSTSTIPTVSTNGGSTATTTPGHFLSNRFVVTDPLTGVYRFETDQEFARRIATDLVLAQQTLQNDFGKPVTAFAYPLNDYGQDTVNFPGSEAIVSQVVSSLYTTAFYQAYPGEGETFNYPDSSAFMFRRIEPGVNWSPQTLLDALNAGRAKTLPYTSSSFGGEWIGGWGSLTGGDTLTLSATPTTSGAEAFLQGSQLWKDYSFNATADWQSGSEMSLIGRRADLQDYISCDFTDGGIFLDKHIQGVSTVVASIPFSPGDVSKHTLHLSLSAQGNNITCSNGALGGTISGVVAEPILQSGGIGVQTWDKLLFGAKVSLSDIQVQ